MKGELDSVAFGTAVAIGVVALPAVLSAWFRVRGKDRPQPPSVDETRWKYVGRVSKIIIYPMKSGKGIELERAQCTQLGFQNIPSSPDTLTLRDRYFMVFRDDNGEMLTGRQYNQLVHCSLTAEAGAVRLSFPGLDDLLIKIPPSHNKRITRMWKGEEVEAIDCGDEASEWLGKVVRSRPSMSGSYPTVRLGYWPSETTTRHIVQVHQELQRFFKGTTNMDGGAFTDLTSYMLMTTSSVEGLNRRLEGGVEVSEGNFRPNLYVDTDQPPFSDLSWKWVKIGDNVFRFVKGCQRCVFTTIDPVTSNKLPNNEPLTTLNTMKEASTEEPIKEKPMMGIHLGWYSDSGASGIVHLSDPVYVIMKPHH